MEIDLKNVTEGVAVGVSSGVVFSILASGWSLLTMRWRKIHTDRERLIEWREFIIKHLHEKSNVSIRVYLTGQFKNKKSPYKYKTLRNEFPIEKMLDHTSDL